MAFASVADLREAAGTTLGYTDWFQIDQDRINLFADATDDHQWIHIDADKAAQGPFGTTIAHGYLTLSLLPAMVAGRFSVEGARMGVNYGLNRVRFPAPVPASSRVRGLIELLEVTEITGGVQVVAKITIEREGGDKPVCVAETLSRIYL
jgi:acyl dehydratase